MIPRRFFWLFDALVIATAFAGARLLAPLLRADFASAGRWRPLIDAFGIPPTRSLGDVRPPLVESLWICVVMIAVVIVSMELLGAYRPILRQSRTRVLGSAMLAPLFGVGCISLMIFTARSLRWSRLFILLFSLLCVVGLAAFRLALRSYRYHRVRAGYHAKHVALVGTEQAVRWMKGYFESRVAPVEYRVWGFLDIEGSPGDVRSLDAPGPERRLGTVSQLGDLLVHQPIHEVIAVHGAQADWVKDVVQQCDYFRVTLRIVPEALLLGSLRDLELVYHGDPLHLPQVVLRPPEFDSDALFLKRVTDIVISGALLVLLAPLFLAIALAIKFTASGLPVFYRWRVIGYKGQPFTGYKFTTMAADADERRGELLERNEMTGPVFKIKDDPRVTMVGRFLRRYSLNELPQLWSVLKGDMSLVGPRPAFPHELQRYELWHKRKLCVKPGITCLWQVRGRNRISNFDDWVRMDLEYIDHWSLWLDFKILVRTAWAVGAGTGS